MEKPKRPSRTCPNDPDHTMHRAFICQVIDGVRKWKTTAWQYCPECQIMLRD